ncbi:MAG: hypothetical protein EA426_12910 [Spirochaetaceae bacterium]|nr:MAG: hypothetical protein EA426_12910 [Spirochaetaceae bacterium]
MAVQPIDLQNLFVRLAEVGREQAVQREAITKGQEVTGQEIVRRAQHNDTAVSEAQEIEDGPDQVHDDEESQSRKHEQSSREGDEKDSGFEQFSDPELGKHIDITG